MIKKTARLIIRLTSFVISSFLLVAVTLILASAISARKGVDLDWWHNEKIDSEFRASDSDTINTLGQYLAREALVFAELEALVERNSPRIDSPFLNRFQK